jgi:hypothetical protein
MDRYDNAYQYSPVIFPALFHLPFILFFHCQQVKKKMCAFLALPRQKPGLHGRAVFLYPRSGYKNTTSRAFRCNSSAPAGLAGFPLQSLAPHGLTYALTF